MRIIHSNKKVNYNVLITDQEQPLRKHNSTISEMEVGQLNNQAENRRAKA